MGLGKFGHRLAGGIAPHRVRMVKRLVDESGWRTQREV